MNEHFRGVVWPKQKNGLYRYVGVGMLVSETPIEGLSEDQIVLDGYAAGMKSVLEAIQQKPSSFRGDANQALLQLENLVESDE